jgi:tRNA-2-methylthio-N6-dimethylallyladenosine synthase
MNTKQLFIKTIGCQMNVYDSERIAGVLEPLKYKKIEDIKNADLIIVNTCTIREKAEQKVYSFLGRLNQMKLRRPELVIGVGGCIAQQQGDKIFDRAPYVDIVFGTHAVTRLPVLMARIEKGHRRVVDIDSLIEPESMERIRQINTGGSASRFVTIMQGCDNFCTYCVVPYVRGREKSRSPESIIAEINDLVNAGVREVTLLGQNVNSYGKKEGLCSFPELLEKVNRISGLYRIRFTTSHPKDLSADLSRSFKNLTKLCRHIHLPVQSGSNLILDKMNRQYTREDYLEKVDELRHYSPDIAITSDFIVGFPGESNEDFSQTIDLIRMVKFDGLFAFKYSDRPEAPARRYKSKLQEEEKNKRLQMLLDIQDRVTLRKNKALVGTEQIVLVEGFGKKNQRSVQDAIEIIEKKTQYYGRTTTNRIVNFECRDLPAQMSEYLAGRLVRVRIEKAYAHSLWGIPLAVEKTPAAVKGENSYAA